MNLDSTETPQLGRLRHAMAFFGAPLASRSAFLAVASLMLAALIAAGLANVGAELANLFGEFTAACHVGGRHAADLRAIHVERNTACHHLDILFLQAGCCAMVASNGAGVACIDAGLELLKSHGNPLIEKIFAIKSTHVLLTRLAFIKRGLCRARMAGGPGN
jgi:hypothetical protein